MLAVPQIERIGTVDPPDFIDVTKPLGGDECHARARALEHGVDGDGGAVQKKIGFRQMRTGLGDPGIDAIHEARRRGQGLAKQQLTRAFVKRSHIGEGAANVGGNAKACGA